MGLEAASGSAGGESGAGSTRAFSVTADLGSGVRESAAESALHSSAEAFGSVN